MSSGSSRRVSDRDDTRELSRLQRRVGKLEHLLDVVDGIVWEADSRTFQFSYVSRQAERLLGYPLEQWTSERDFWSSHLHPDDRERAVRYCAGAARGGRGAEFEYRMITADGGVLWLHDIVTVDTTDPSAPMLRGLMIDITSRKQTEQRLARQHQALLGLAKSAELARAEFPDFSRLALETAAQTMGVERNSVWLFNRDRSVLRCEDLYERTPHRHSDGVELEAANFPRYFAALAAGRFVAADDARTDSKTSEFAESYLIPLGITSMLDAPLRVAGEVIGVVCHEHVGATRTWTQDERDFAASSANFVELSLEAQRRKEAERLARSAQRQLLAQQRLETERVERELERIRDRLVEQTRLSTIGQVAASIAHELRNPLGAIRNAQFFLTRRLADGEPKWSEHLGIIEQEVNSADRIIGNLLEMTRVKEPRKERVDLAEAARSAFERIEGRAAVELEARIDPGSRLIEADREQLQQVLAELFNNAVQAMDGRGGIRVTAHVTGNEDLITVADDGPGVAPASRDLVFEPLYTTKAKGTGLGLPICRQIIERHGGSLALMEHGAAGACFAIRLPRGRR